MSKTFFRIVAAVIAATLVIVSGATTAAQAAPYRVGFSVKYKGSNKTIGTLDTRPGSPDHRVICTNSNVADPTKLPKSQLREDAQLNYLMLKYIDGKDDVTGAALTEIVKEKLDESQPVRKAVWAAFKKTQKTNADKVEKKMVDLKTEAKKLAGPYTIEPKLVVVDYAKQTGNVTGIGIKTASGAWYPGVPITVTLSGPAVFNGYGNRQVTLTSTAQPQTLEWRATGLGEIEVLAKTTAALPGTTYRYFPPAKPGVQSMVSANFNRITVEGKDPHSYETVVQPVLSSKVGASYGKVGDKLTDTVSLSKGVAGTKVPISVTMYGPLATQPQVSKTVPANTPKAWSHTQTVTVGKDGTASAKFTAPAAKKAGYYVWVESSAAAGNMKAATSTFGRAVETTAVLEPKLSTVASTQTAKVGATITDTVTVSGINVVRDAPQPVFTMKGAAYGPLAPAEDGTCQGLDWAKAKVAHEIKEQATKNGTHKGIGKYKVTEAGCYTYGQTLIGKVGGKTVWTYDHKPGIPAQTTLVRNPDPLEPVLSSMVGDSYGKVGDKLTDTVSLSKGVAGTKVPVSVTMYGPLATQPEVSDTVPAGTPTAWSSTQTVTVGADGTASAKFTAPAVKEPGYYVWVESSAAAGNMKAATSTFGRVSETTAVLEPKLSTVASTQTANVGDTITDTVEVSGINVVRDTTQPVFTMKGAAYGPLAPAEDGTCKGLDWAAAKVAHEIKEQAATNGTHANIGAYKVTEHGCYTYGETLIGKVGGEIVWTYDHKPGIPVQTTLVTEPVVSTVASIIEGKFVDAIKIAGTNGANGKAISSAYYLPGTIGADGEILCPAPGDEWDGAKLLATHDPIAFEGDSELTSVGVELGESGCYSYGVTLDFGADHPAVTEKPGQPDQTIGYRANAGLIIESGLPGNPTANMMIGVGIVVLIGAAGGGFILYRRQTTKQ